MVQVKMNGYSDRVDSVPSTLRHDEFGDIAALRGLRERGYYPEVIFDVGAAIGDWTYKALEFWPKSEFFLFEALAERKAPLEEVKVKNSSTSIEILISGIGNFDGKLSMGVTKNLFDSSFAYDGEEAREIDCFRLDTLYRQGKIKKPDFLKMDVQGYELNILEGAKEVLSECSVILMECQFFKFCDSMNTLDTTIKKMSDMDFVPYEFVDFLRRPLDGAMGQCDILFVKRGHWLVAEKKWA